MVSRVRGHNPPRTKGEAVTLRDTLRGEIRSGTFADPHAPANAPAPPTADSRVTLGHICDEYLKRHVRTPTRRPGGIAMAEVLLGVMRRAEIPAAHGTTVRLESKVIAEICKADIEAVRTWRRAELAAGRSRPGAKGGEAGINRLLSRLRHVFNWAIGEGYLTATPFKRGPVTVVKIDRTIEHARTRRLDAEGEENEERRILAHADPHLRAVLTAALTTGCRIGEILSLQWSQIRRDEAGEARWLVLPAAKTKTGETRVIPIGSDLRAVLSLRRHAPDGQEHARTAFVFGNDAGEQVKSIRIQWEDAVLRAHGHTPERRRGKLTAAARATLATINLHVHDLRREFASRLLEASADLHDVQLFLGHSTITTTSRYLQSTPTRLQRALDKLEGAGFAHHSHTDEETQSERATNARGEIAANALN
jgi:integrase